MTFRKSVENVDAVVVGFVESSIENEVEGIAFGGKDGVVGLRFVVESSIEDEVEGITFNGKREDEDALNWKSSSHL